jgi:hypothetical protein
VPRAVVWSPGSPRKAFVRENLPADPRVKYVPELEGERFQSLIWVPVLARDGDSIGVISMHTEAPREFAHRNAIARLSGYTESRIMKISLTVRSRWISGENPAALHIAK